MSKKGPQSNKIVPPLARVQNLPLLDEEDYVLDQHPSTLFQCRKRDGSLDWQLYIAYRNRKSEQEYELWEADWDDWGEDQEDNAIEEEPKKKKARPSKKLLLCKGLNASGGVVDLKPTETPWCAMYVLPRVRTPAELAKFRLCFCLPFLQFLEVIEKS
jgi:hypothetical protein